MDSVAAFAANAREFQSEALSPGAAATIMLPVGHNITLVINGESRDFPAIENVQELVDHLGIARDRIAVELNRRIIRRSDWVSTPLRGGDRIEVVQFVGGG